jgi:pyruvate,water dikinase
MAADRETLQSGQPYPAWGDAEDLRSYKPGREDPRVFWFRDDLHNPYPITPLGMSTVNRGHMWGFALAAEESQVPPSKGAVIKTHGQRVYLGFTNIGDPAEIGRRAERFGPYVERAMSDWENFYGSCRQEGKDLTLANIAVEREALSHAELAAHLRTCYSTLMKCWFFHFKTMYVAYGVYIAGEEVVKGWGLEEKDYTTMLKGFETIATASDRGQYELCCAALESAEVTRAFDGDTPSAEMRSRLLESEDGRRWLARLQQYLDDYGHRLAAAILDVNHPTWFEDPTPVIENVRQMMAKKRAGWDFEEERRETARRREDAIADFRATLTSEQQAAFDQGLPAWQKGYAYGEDHWYYWEQVAYSGIRYAALEAGRRLTELGITDSPEDVFNLAWTELLETIDAVAEYELPAAYMYSHLLRPLIAERADLLTQAESDKGPAFLGSSPDSDLDPIGVKVFGLTEVLFEKARRELAGEQAAEKLTFEGFPGAPGLVEGRARVVLEPDGFAKVKVGDILVCPFTSPAWTPLFPKIRAIVTDSGGMLTHAAVAAREYGVPAVVGTWTATTTVHDGDLIRVDGTNGVVEVLERAQA